MRAGVAAFIAKAAPATPMPPLALTEFQITAAYSGAGNATERLVSARPARMRACARARARPPAEGVAPALWARLHGHVHVLRPCR